MLVCACSSPKTSKQTELWMDADYVLFFRPFDCASFAQKMGEKSSFFQPIPFYISILKNKGIDEKSIWKLFVCVDEKKLLLSIQLSDTSLFDSSIRPFIGNSTLSKSSWSVIRSSHFFVKRIGKTALFFTGEEKNIPSKNELLNTQKGRSYDVYQQILKDKRVLFQLAPSATRTQRNGLLSLSISCDGKTHKKITFQLSAEQGTLPQLKSDAWRVKNELDTNYLALSFDAQKALFLAQNIVDELTWIDASFYQKIHSFLAAWKGDLLVLIGGDKTEKTEQIITELDENFNSVERKVSHEQHVQNELIAISINEKWSSFENVMSSKSPLIARSAPSPIAVAPIPLASTQEDTMVKTDWNLSKSQGFFILHRANKCPELVKARSKTSLYYNGLYFELVQATDNRWKITVR